MTPSLCENKNRKELVSLAACYAASITTIPAKRYGDWIIILRDKDIEKSKLEKQKEQLKDDFGVLVLLSIGTAVEQSLRKFRGLWHLLHTLILDSGEIYMMSGPCPEIVKEILF